MRHGIRLEYITASELPWSRARQLSGLVGQQLQWGPEKRIQMILVDFVEAEIVGGDIGISVSVGCPRVVLFKGERCISLKNLEPK